jgi:hypothetical protein
VSIATARWMDAVAGLPCVLCAHLERGPVYGVELHHLFDAHQRNDWLVAPLCPDCHRGPNGFHGLGGEPGFRRRYKLGEAELLALTLESLDKSRRAA